MKTMLFENNVINTRHGLINAEDTRVEMPDKYWHLLGIIEVKNLYLKEKLLKADSLLEISEEMFDILPEINQLIDITPKEGRTE